MAHEHHGKRKAHAAKALVARQGVPLLSVPNGGGTNNGATTSPANNQPIVVVPPTTTTPTTAAPPPNPITTTITSTSTAPPPDTHTTAPSVVIIQQTSTTTPSRTDTRSSSTLPTSSLPNSTSTNIVIKSISASISPSGIIAAASSTSTSTDSASTGTIIGAVAGALVGVVVLSGLIGYLFRAKFSKRSDDDDDDPFARDFRRDSIRLPDDDYDEMSQISHSRQHDLYRAGVGRSDTLNSADSGAPRPPTFIQRHLDYAVPAQATPSFQPGQLINSNYYGNTAAYGPGDAVAWNPAAAAAGGYPYPQARDSARGASQQGSPPSRSGSQREPHHEVVGYGNHQLPGVSEEEEEELPSRSGTPVDPNPQNAYYAHGSRDGSTDQKYSPANERVLRSGGGGGHRMSVRNGGYDYDDAYGGM